MSKSELDKAASYAYRLLGIRARSEKELEKRLVEKRYTCAIIDEVVSALKKQKMLDDYGFAKAWVESRMRSNPRASIFLKRELESKGIEASIIERVLSVEKIEEDSIVRTLASQKMKALSELPKEKAKSRLFAFLARRGFNFDTINSVINELLK